MQQEMSQKCLSQCFTHKYIIVYCGQISALLSEQASRGHLASLCSPVPTRAADCSPQSKGSCCPCRGLRRLGRPGQRVGEKAAGRARGSYRNTRKMAPGKSRGLLDDVLTEGLMKKVYCLTPPACRKMAILSFSPVMQPCFLSLRNTRLEGREAVRVTPPGHWVGAWGLASPSCSAEMGSRATGGRG